MKTDLSYITDGFYITLFANTDDGVNLYNEIASHFGGYAKFPVSIKDSVFYQIKRAGFSIRKQRKSRKTTDQILAELTEIGL
jgi:hypothetical protein